MAIVVAQAEKPTLTGTLARLEEVKPSVANEKLCRSLDSLGKVLMKMAAATIIIEKKGTDEEKKQHEGRLESVCQHINRIIDLVLEFSAAGPKDEKERILGLISSNSVDIKNIGTAIREVSERLERELSAEERGDILGKIKVAEPLDAKAPAQAEQPAAPAPVEKVEQKPQEASEEMKAGIEKVFMWFVGAEHFDFFKEGNRLQNELDALDAESLRVVHEIIACQDASRRYFTEMAGALKEENKLEAAKVALNVIKSLRESYNSVSGQRLGLALDYIRQEGAGNSEYWGQFGQCWVRELEILEAVKKDAASRDAENRVVIAKG